MAKTRQLITQVEASLRQQQYTIWLASDVERCRINICCTTLWPGKCAFKQNMAHNQNKQTTLPITRHWRIRDASGVAGATGVLTASLSPALRRRRVSQRKLAVDAHQRARFRTSRWFRAYCLRDHFGGERCPTPWDNHRLSLLTSTLRS